MKKLNTNAYITVENCYNTGKNTVVVFSEWIPFKNEDYYGIKSIEIFNLDSPTYTSDKKNFISTETKEIKEKVNNTFLLYSYLVLVKNCLFVDDVSMSNKNISRHERKEARSKKHKKWLKNKLGTDKLIFKIKKTKKTIK